MYVNVDDVGDNKVPLWDFYCRINEEIMLSCFNRAVFLIYIPYTFPSVCKFWFGIE